jgi:pentose-5-phosphate-3-epimerase
MVYVDDMEAEFGNMIMCHMMADTHEELIEMAKKIGVQLKWIQYEGTYKEHFDICKTKRKKAIANGAIEIEWKETSRKMDLKRLTAK